MFRVLTAGAALGLAALTAAPAAAEQDIVCFSVGLACQGHSCPDGYRTVFNNGFNDTGPWLVICSPL